MKNINYISKRSIHLLSLNRSQTSFSPRTGCIIEYQGNFFLCTVSHNLPERDFFLNLLSDSATNQEIYAKPLNSPNLVVKTDITKFANVEDFMELINQFDPKDKRFEQVDFAYLDVSEFINKDPSQPELDIYQRGKKIDEFIIGKGNKNIIYETQLGIPNFAEKYSFIGRVRVEKTGSQIYYKYKYESDLEYLGRNGDYDYFKLKQYIQSDKDYIGTSGAPIFDSSGYLVGLVKGGSQNKIRSVPIEKVKILLEVENKEKERKKENGV